MLMRTGYMRLNWPRIEARMIEQQVSRSDLVAAGVGYKSLKKIANGDQVQRKTAHILISALQLNPRDDLARFLLYGNTDTRDSEELVAPKSWIPAGDPSAWKTTRNGLQYRLQKLRHAHLPGVYGRGKCYDVAQFDDDTRQRVSDALSRHPMVLTWLSREPAFPQHAASGFVDADHFWVVDYFEDGITFDDYLSSEDIAGRGLPVPEVVDLMTQLIMALLELHVRNILRRELTPDSILIRPDGGLLLTDLELCKLSAEYPTVRRGELARSPFLAPELSGPKINDRVDVYSWAKMFLYAATGKRPPEFVTTTCTELPGFPKRIRHLLQCATSHSYRDRPSAAGVMGVLQRMNPEN